MTHAADRARRMLAESGIAEEGNERLVACLTTLEEYAEGPAPDPTPELAVLMAQLGHDDHRVSPLRRRPGRVLIAGAVAFGTVAAGGIAAAANELPPGAQDLVADLTERYLHVDMPRSHERPGPQSGAVTDPGSGGGGPGQVPVLDDGTVAVVVDEDVWDNLGEITTTTTTEQPVATPSAPPPSTAPTPSLTPSPRPSGPPSSPASPSPQAPVKPSVPAPTGAPTTPEDTVEAEPEVPPSTAPGSPSPTSPAPSPSASSPPSSLDPGTPARGQTGPQPPSPPSESPSGSQDGPTASGSAD